MAQSLVRPLVDELRRFNRLGPAEQAEQVDDLHEKYVDFLDEADAPDCRELQALCSSDMALLQRWWRLFKGTIVHDSRFPDHETGGWTQVMGLVFEVETADYRPLLPLPSDARKELRRYLEEDSEFPGDIHLSTVALMLPADQLALVPESTLLRAAATTQGQEMFSQKARLSSLFMDLEELEDLTDLRLVVFVALHLSVDDVPEDELPTDWDDFDAMCSEVGATPGYAWDLTEVLGGDAHLQSCWEAEVAIGEACAGETSRALTDGVVELLNSGTPAPEHGHIRIHCVPAEPEEVLGGRLYGISVRLLDGEQQLASYDFGSTLSPAYAIGFVVDRIQLMGWGSADIELVSDRA